MDKEARVNRSTTATKVSSGLGPAMSRRGELRVLATFIGWHGLPWVALASNSLNPVFRLESGQLVFRVLRLRQRRYAEVREVDVRSTHGTFNLILTFRDARLTFVANVGTAARQRPSVRACACCAAAATA